VVTYNVDTDPRIRIYFALAFVSIVGASFLTDYLEALASFLTDYLKNLETVLQFIVAPSIAPFAIFGILLWLFDRYLWKWPLICRVSGIPNLEGTWEGTLTRISSDDCKQGEPARRDRQKAELFITQTWRSMGFVFYDHTESEKQEKQRAEEPTRIATARTVGMSVKNPQDIHVRYVYGARQTTMLHNLRDVDAMPSEGAAVLRLRDLGDKDKRLWGTYYSDKMRRGDIDLVRKEPGRPREGAPPT
jgi:hypothetical protein